MTKVQKIDNNYKKPLLNAKNTGYIAASTLLATTLRSFSKAKPITKSHKFLGLFSAIMTLLHIGIIEYQRYKYKKM